MATTSLITLVQEVLKRLSLLETGTATGGSTANLIAAAFPYKNTSSNADATTYQDCVILVNDTTAATSYDQRLIKTYAPSTGTFTPSNAFTITVASGDTFSIIKGGVRYDDVKDAINRALGKIYHRHTTVLTLITDGDMEASTSGWTDSTNATSTKVTSGLAGMRGNKAIRVAGGAADSYTQSGDIYCRSSQVYLLRATVGASAGTGELVAYDVTNSAEIETDTWDEIGEGVLQFYFTTPATCEIIAVRLQGLESTTNVYWDDVVLLRDGSRELALPAAITKWEQVKRIYYSSFSSNADDLQYFDFDTVRAIPDTSSANNEWRVWLDPSIHNPVWIEAEIPYASLDLYADTTTCNKELLILAATSELLDVLINRAPGQETAAWGQELKRVNRKLVPLLWNRASPSLRHQLNG